VGSTNLNIASWLGNCELDAVIENDEFARQMEEQYRSDLSNATEVMLDLRRKVGAPGEPRHRMPAAGSHQRRREFRSCRRWRDSNRQCCWRSVYESQIAGAGRSALNPDGRSSSFSNGIVSVLLPASGRLSANGCSRLDRHGFDLAWLETIR
jgi:hypothetical protein